MPVDIVVPSFGESISEGTVAQWLKKAGEFVNKDDILLEVESEKATQGIPSPAAGVLHATAKEGDKVAVGAVIGSIDDSAAAAPAAPPAKANAAPQRPAAAQPVAQQPKAEPRPASKPHAPPITTLAPPPVLSAAAAPSSSDGEKRVPMSAIRQRIAERLLASQKMTASLTTFNEADMSAIIDLRSRYKDRFKERHGVSLGFLPFFAKACIDALRAFPNVNAAIDGRDVVFHGHYNLGIAVSTEKGLIVPVVQDADRLTFAQIEQRIAELATKARDGKIEVADLQGGTFTITNGGIFGSMMSTPILNFPQAAILGMHTIQKRPVVRDDAIVIRPMMYLALTYDHRLIDGREAVLFLVRVKDCLEDPQRLMLDI
jgi:2-oxoglutarate dehydrogenase E2 component (dihydrolipoamide succinyltransferase)